MVNVTETCDPSNDFQLILKVQSAPHVTEDTALLKDALPELKDRTDVDTLYNDAGFCGPAVDDLLNKLEITQVPSALSGRAAAPEHTTLADCDIHLDVDGTPISLACPHGYTAYITLGRKERRFIARWAEDACPECHFSSHHAGHKPSPKTCLRFSKTDLVRALRRQLMRAYRQGNRHLRAAIEATVGALKRPFNNESPSTRPDPSSSGDGWVSGHGQYPTHTASLGKKPRKAPDQLATRARPPCTAFSFGSLGPLSSQATASHP